MVHQCGVVKLLLNTPNKGQYRYRSILQASKCGKPDDTILLLICILNFSCFSEQMKHLPFIYMMTKFSVTARNHIHRGKKEVYLIFSIPYFEPIRSFGWLVVLGLTALWDSIYIVSISGHLPKRGRKRRERIKESKNVQTTPTRTYCKRSRPLPYYYPNCRTPRHWKFTQHHRTTRPPLGALEGRWGSIDEFTTIPFLSCPVTPP